MKKIYVNFEIPAIIREFLLKFFSHGIFRGAVETFNDKECTIQQCRANKYRSFDDMFDVIKTYFPNTTEKEFLNELITLSITTGHKAPQILYPQLYACSTMRRIRITYVTAQQYSLPFQSPKYDSKYSWKELLTMLNINNATGFREYIEKHKEQTQTI